MKYCALFFVFIFIGLSSCKEPEKKPHITHDVVKNLCEKPTASFPMQVLGIPILLFHHDNCMSHDALLTVMWPDVGRELERKASELIILAYAKFKSSETTTCTTFFLNHDKSKDEIMTASFYILKCVKKEKND